MDKIKGWNRRMEKVRYGDMWVNQYTYKINDSVIGIVTKNPYTDKYETRASDFINHKYILDNFDKLSEARQFISDYAKVYMRANPNG